MGPRLIRALSIAAALAVGVGAGYAVSNDATKEAPALVIPAGAGTIYTPDQEWKLLGNQSGGRLSVMEVTNSPVREFRDAHVHTREEEGWFVIDGELEFEIGRQRASAGPGTMIWAPRDVPHRYRVARGPAHYLVLFSPAGIEGLFKDVAEIRNLKPGTPEHSAELERRREKYGARAAQIPQ
jgi:quercetin dioxygenase-like cupin family protein